MKKNKFRVNKINLLLAGILFIPTILGVTEVEAISSEQDIEDVEEVNIVQDEKITSAKIKKPDNHIELVNNLKQEIIDLKMTDSLDELFEEGESVSELTEKAILNHELQNWDIASKSYDQLLDQEILNEENSDLIFSFKKIASNEIILSDYLSDKENESSKDKEKNVLKEESDNDTNETMTMAVNKPQFAYDFIDSIAPYAMKVGKKYGVYPSVMIAQASLESAWGGQGKVADDYELGIAPNYNLFGIKGRYKGQSLVVKTQEVLPDGERITIDAEFKKYPSYEASMEDYASKLRYSKETEIWNPYLYTNTWVENTNSYIDAIEGLSSWATDPKYQIKLKELVEDYSLTKYDDIKFDDRNKAADKLYRQYRQSNNARTLWKLAQNFATIYPGDSRAKEVINEAAEKHVNYAISRHKSGDYDYALGNYNNVLNEGMVSSSYKVTVASYKSFAENRQKIQTADKLYKEYKASNNARVLWGLAQNFVNYYPNDSRAKNVINEAAKKHVNYAVSRHNSGDYTYALGNYSNVLNEKMVSSSYKTIVASYKSFAGNRQNIQTANELYKKYKGSNNARVLWNLAQDFITYYPNDSRANNVINEAAKKHVNYAVKRHNNGDYAFALTNYNNVLKEKKVDTSYKKIVKSYKEFAENRQNIQTADQLYKKYKGSNNARVLWVLAQDFVDFYPADSRAKNVINEAAEKHVNYGVSRHNSGDYAFALVNYNNVLNEKMVSTSYKNTVSEYKTYAERKQPLPTADFLYKEYKKTTNARTLWLKAQDFINKYPDDSRADSVINEAAEKHVNYAVSRHNSGDFSYALGNYNNVVNEKKVNNTFKIRVREMIAYAEKNQKLPTANDLYTKYKRSNNARVLWNLAQDFIYYYPDDSRVSSVINEAANKHMKYALRLQRRDDSKKTASKYYKRVLAEPTVSKSTRHLAKIFLNQSSTNRKRVVYVDSGHGGKDSGAAFYGVTEKQLNLRVSDYLTKELESKGYVVINSRTTDKFIELTDRAMEANNVNADVFVSVHHNSMGGKGTASGIETFIHHRVKSGFGQETNANKFKIDDPRISESLLLANSIHANLIKDTRLYDRGVKGNNYSVLRNTYIPSILVELGFMDNKTEASILKTKSYQMKAAKSIANGIDIYFKGSN